MCTFYNVKTKRKNPLPAKRVFRLLLVCEDQVSLQQHINEVDGTEEPTPTDEQERKENNDVHGVFRS